MSPRIGKLVSQTKGERSEIIHTRVTPGTYNRLLLVAYESGWTLSTAINAAIENGLADLEFHLEFEDAYEAQQHPNEEKAKDLEKLEANLREAREKFATQKVKQLKKQGKLKA